MHDPNFERESDVTTKEVLVSGSGRPLSARIMLAGIVRQGL